MALAQELYAFIADDENEEEQCNNVGSRVVQKEMMLYEITKRRPNNLEKLKMQCSYAVLKTIKLTLVEAEHAFFTLGCCLDDETIDALLFLHHYYSK